MSTYATAKLPTPVYNTQGFSHTQKILPKDHQGLLKDIEFIALPGTKFKIMEEAPFSNILQVSTAEYSSSIPLYVNKQFLQTSVENISDRSIDLPAAQTIVQFMRSLVGTRYFWGGNWAKGIPEMSQFYPQFKEQDRDDVECRGVDCSGLLYQATNGWTPRNTGDLCNLGKELEVNKTSVSDVEEAVKPLDMMVWKGHVVLILDSNSLIESTLYQGVIISDIKERYLYYFNKLALENKAFYLRRWHPDFLS